MERRKWTYDDIPGDADDLDREVELRATVYFDSLPTDDLLEEMAQRITWIREYNMYENPPSRPSVPRCYVVDIRNNSVTFGYKLQKPAGGQVHDWVVERFRMAVEIMIGASEVRDSEWELNSVRVYIPSIA